MARFITRRGVNIVNERGDEYWVNPSPCCGHNDCFHVTLSKEIWKCFSCGRGGDVFDLAMIVENVDKAEALRLVADEAGIAIERREEPKEEPATRGKAAVWSAAVKLYHNALLHNDEMLAYQLGEGKWSGIGRHHSMDTLRAFRVGWADGTLGQELAERFSPADLIKSGLVVKNEHGQRDFFRNCFVYPQFDAAGRPLHFRCKFPKTVTGEKTGNGYQLPTEHRSKEWVCYNQTALGKHDTIIVCEGEDDLLTWTECGAPNVVATCGGPSKEQLDFLVKHHGGKTYILAYDADNAGALYVERFYKRGLKIRVAPEPASIEG